jgi:hypothetical protein
MSVYESFAKLITKMGLLRVILYYLNPITPPKNTPKWGFYPVASYFHITFCYYIRLLQFVTSFARDSYTVIGGDGYVYNGSLNSSPPFIFLGE